MKYVEVCYFNKKNNQTGNLNLVWQKDELIYLAYRTSMSPQVGRRDFFFKKKKIHRSDLEDGKIQTSPNRVHIEWNQLED